MFAAMEDKIIARLKERAADPAYWTGGPLTIEPERDVARVEELRNKAPGIWVLQMGFRPRQTPGPTVNTAQLVEVDWLIVAAAKTARGNGAGTAARDEASEISLFAVASLLGFDLGGGKSLRLTEGPGPEYDAGYCLIPVAFTCLATFMGKP